MPNRRLVARELSGLMKSLAHPDRILIVQLLASQQCYSVNAIAVELDLPPARVSQHLSTLKAIRLVSEHRSGRERLYSLVEASLALWLVGGVDFVAGFISDISQEQVADAKKLWLDAMPPANGD